MQSGDFDSFSALIRDMCAAFDRQATDDRVRVFWQALRRYHLHDVKRAVEAWLVSQRRMPSPRDLAPESTTEPQKRIDGLPQMSRWAIAANRILFSVAYQGDRGFIAMGDKLQSCLNAKSDYVRMAEQAEMGGEPWEVEDFNRLCREGFQTVLGCG